MSYDARTSTALINRLRSDVDSLQIRIATVLDEKPIGTSGGASVAGVWTTRTLNTIHSDPFGLILNGTVSGSTFTLAPGNYQIEVVSSYHSTLATRTRIYDVTNAQVVGYSISGYVFNQTIVNLHQTERVSPHKDTTYRIEYYTEQAKADGLGIASGVGDVEVYTVLNVVALDIRST